MLRVTFSNPGAEISLGRGYNMVNDDGSLGTYIHSGEFHKPRNNQINLRVGDTFTATLPDGTPVTSEVTQDMQLTNLEQFAKFLSPGVILEIMG